MGILFRCQLNNAYFDGTKVKNRIQEQPSILSHKLWPNIKKEEMISGLK